MAVYCFGSMKTGLWQYTAIVQFSYCFKTVWKLDSGSILPQSSFHTAKTVYCHNTTRVQFLYCFQNSIETGLWQYTARIQFLCHHKTSSSQPKNSIETVWKLDTCLVGLWLCSLLYMSINQPQCCLTSEIEWASLIRIIAPFNRFFFFVGNPPVQLTTDALVLDDLTVDSLKQKLAENEAKLSECRSQVKA